MTSTINCPHCENSLQNDPDLAGQLVMCPRCQEKFTMSEATEATRIQISTESEAVATNVNSSINSTKVSDFKKLIERIRPKHLVFGAIGILFILGILLEKEPLPSSATVYDWENAYNEQKEMFLATHSKYFEGDTDQREKKWVEECKKLGVIYDFQSEVNERTSEYCKLEILDYSDYRLDIYISDVNDFVDELSDSNLAMVDVLKKIESQKEEEILSIQLKERAELLPEVLEYERKMAKFRELDRELEEQAERERRESMITLQEYQSIGYLDSPESVELTLGVEGTERSSNSGYKIIGYSGANGVTVSVSYRLKEGEWIYEGKSQVGLD